MLLTASKPARLVRWAMELAEYDFEIKHRSGRNNQNADALSRLPIEGDLTSEIDHTLGIIQATGNIIQNLIIYYRYKVHG